VSYQDKTLTCVECGTPFVFSASEQAFYAERGFANEPKRCPACRQNRKAARALAGHGDAPGAAGTGGPGGNGYGSQRTMHVVTCSACGGEARVPFVPRGDRPVYCSDCYSQYRGSSYSRA
jgi:CxxC-x17-CxxC domain-containing protein